MFFQELRFKIIWLTTLVGCVTPTQDQGQREPDGSAKLEDRFSIETEAPRAPSATKKPGKIYAEPITPETAEEYPHLQRHVGQILLGNTIVQAVLAGIPAIPSPSPWQPAILELFRREGETWQRLGSSGPLESKITTRQGQHFYAIGLDTEITTRRASVYFVLATGESHGAKTKITYSLTVDQPSVQIIFEDFIAAKAKVFAESNWELRLRPNLGKVVTTADAGNPKLTRSLTHYLGKDHFSLIGFSPLQLNQDLQEITLAPATNSKRYYPGVILVIGTDEQNATALKIAATEACSEKQLLTPQPDHQEVQKCLLENTGARVELTASAEPSEIANFPRQLYLRDPSGRILGYGALLPGETLKALVQPDSSYEVVEVTATGLDAKAQFSLQGNQVAKVFFKPRQVSKLAISQKHDDTILNIPAFLSVRDLKDLEGSPVVKSLNPDDTALPITAHTLLVKRWPAKLTLPEGHYQITVFRGHKGRLCQFDVKTSADKPDLSHDCQIQKEDMRREAVITSAITGDFATHLANVDETLLARILGVHILSTSNDESNYGENTISFMPVLEVFEPTYGLNMRLLPTTTELNLKWQDFQKTARGDRLLQFSTFAREFAKDAILELGCANTHLNLEDYRRIVMQLQPDAVQIYGCGLPGHQERLFQLANELQAGRRTRLLITAASFLDSFLPTYHLPQVAIAKDKLPILRNKPFSPDDILQVLKSGSFSLSSGAILEVKEKADRPIALTSSSTRDSQSQSLTVQIERLPDTIPQRLIIYNENGLVFESPLTFKNEKTVTLPIAFKSRSKGKWLRLEVRGEAQAATRTVRGKNEIILASTNFLPVD